MSMRRPLAVMAVLVVVAMATFSGSQVARAATTYVWSGPNLGSCNTPTLQACITNALSGDTVLVATNTPINESPQILKKSLTLGAQTGYSPTITGDFDIQNESGGTVDDTVSHIAFSHTVFVQISVGSGNVVNLDHISAVSSGADPGLYGIISAGSTVNVTSSSFTETGFYPGIDLTVPNANGSDVTFNLTGNYVSGGGTTQSLGGIQVSASDANNFTVNLYNNAVWKTGQGSDPGTGAAVSLYASNSTSANFNMVGNTIARVTNDGILVDDGQTAPHKFSLDMYNNIVTNTTASAVDAMASDATTFVLASGSNDFYLNHKKNKTLGKSLGSNLAVQPKYTDLATGDLTLTPGSPVINAGVVCSPAGVADPDAAGNHRLAGSSVDMGAYERGASAPTGIVVVGGAGPNTITGTSGADILCGYAGDDTIFGNGGNDYIDGGTGNDKLYAGNGNSDLYGRAGNDLLCAKNGTGGDYLNGGSGTDSYQADSGDTRVSLEKKGDCTA